MRLIDADAYAAEMRGKQDACQQWLATTEGGDEMHIRAEQAMATFIEASLTLKNQPTIAAIPVEWIKQQPIYQTIAVRALIERWQKEQEAR